MRGWHRATLTRATAPWLFPQARAWSADFLVRPAAVSAALAMMATVWISCLYSDLRPFYLYWSQKQQQSRGGASPKAYEQKLAPRPKLAYWFNLFAPLSLGIPVLALLVQLAVRRA